MLLSESAISSKTPESAVAATCSGGTGKRFWQILFILLSLEIGAFLAVAPWSSVWERSLIAGYLAPLRPILLNYYVRGGLSGLGIINLWVGVSHARASRRLSAAAPSDD